jgi:hypothetical protein
MLRWMVSLARTWHIFVLQKLASSLAPVRVAHQTH